MKEAHIVVKNLTMAYGSFVIQRKLDGRCDWSGFGPDRHPGYPEAGVALDPRDLTDYLERHSEAVLSGKPQ